VPTVGGALCCNFKLHPWGPLDQRPVESRSDVLVFTSSPRRQPLDVAGPVRATLFVASDSPDTDFTAKLVDVAPDGNARILCDGLLRLRYRQGVQREIPYTPGTVERIEIALGSIAHRFLPGHALRLDVASSNFPRFDRNLNTGRPQSNERELRPARQSLHLSRERPSALLLPVLP
jgi:putative CocE/NonD family hydrolase